MTSWLIGADCSGGYSIVHLPAERQTFAIPEWQQGMLDFRQVGTAAPHVSPGKGRFVLWAIPIVTIVRNGLSDGRLC
jgi:hypothetical protein